MKIRIYVLCYNKETQRIAEAEYGDKEWAKVLFIDTTALLECIMYDSWLKDHYDDWKDFDYVGTLSWKASQKIRLLDMDKLGNILDVLPFDVVPFYVSNLELLKASNWSHPDFKKIWITIIRNLGYSEDIAVDDSIIPFYCNYWITKPDLMLKYIEFFNKAKSLIDTNEDIQGYISNDSGYVGALSRERCQELFGKPYYTYHPFIYERLPCFYFWISQKKIMNPTVFLEIYKA